MLKALLMLEVNEALHKLMSEVIYVMHLALLGQRGGRKTLSFKWVTQGQQLEKAIKRTPIF